MSQQSDPAKLVKNKRLLQTDIPSLSLEEALRVPTAIMENYAGTPSSPLRVASALNMSPSSGPFRALCGAAIGYGLTEGGYNAAQISLTSLGKQIIRPTEDGADLDGKRKAFLTPTVISAFLNKYNKALVPTRMEIAMNVLAEMYVPRSNAQRVFDLIIEGAKNFGLIREIKGKLYVDLDGVVDSEKAETGIGVGGLPAANVDALTVVSSNSKLQENVATQVANNRVYVSHGKDRSITSQIKELLSFGKFVPVISVENESTAIPVPEKVFEDLRSCVAAVIHVMSEGEWLDPKGQRINRLNENVLIEIGAAIAICKKNVILLVEKGTSLPSNLQGLYLCEYCGEKLDYEATMKLLKTFNQFHI